MRLDIPHTPARTYEQRRKGEKGLPDKSESERAISLKVMLQKLMNRAVTMNAQQAYVNTLEESYWPPYVELLVRGGIAEKHPNDSRLLRLVRFHE